MIPLALQVVLLAWTLQFADTRSLLDWPLWVWLLAVAVAAVCGGSRWAFLAGVAAWVIGNAAAVVGDRLPADDAGRDVAIVAIVCDFPRQDAEATRFVVLVDESAAGRIPSRLHLSWYDDAPRIRPGERWRLLVRLKPPHGASNPAGFDFEHWLYSRGIGATGYVRNEGPNARLVSDAVVCPVGRLRERIASGIEQALAGQRGAGHVLGIAVGATHLITPADWDLMRRTGTTHLLAISGLNIAMVVAPLLLAISWLLRFLPRLTRFIPIMHGAVLLLAALYSALSGFAVSTVRAFLMLALVLVLAARRRSADIVDVLAAVAIASVLIDPASVTGASFWLSFVAVAWLVVACTEGPQRQRGPAGFPVWLRFAGQQARALVKAQLVLAAGLLPLGLAWFEQISLAAPLSNLFAVPVFSIAVMPPALAGAALLDVVPALAVPLLRTAAATSAWLFDRLEPVASLEHAIWHPPVTQPVVLLLACLAVLLLAWPRPIPGRLIGLACLLPVAFGMALVRPALRITVLDVGQGLAVLVETRAHALLYDTGPIYRQRDAGESIVVPVLRRAGWRHLDAVVVSHEDADHRGGLASVLAAVAVRRLYAPRDLGATLPVTPCRRGQRWRHDGVEFEMLSPDGERGWSSDNDSSCVLALRAGAVSVLLPGDIELQREDWLARRGLLRPTTLVVAPHHGSRTSSGEAFVAATRPRYLVASAGYRNRWGFPRAEVVRRWAEGGACVVDTAGSGAVVFELAPGGELHLAGRHRDMGGHVWTANAAPVECTSGAAEPG